MSMEDPISANSPSNQSNQYEEEDGEISESQFILQTFPTISQGTQASQPGTLVFDRSRTPTDTSATQSHIQKWDDSTLIAAWDAAFLEYQRKHSKSGIKSKGIEESGLKYYKKRSAEELEVVLQRLKKKAKVDNNAPDSKIEQRRHSHASSATGSHDRTAHVDNGEVDETAEGLRHGNGNGIPNGNHTQQPNHDENHAHFEAGAACVNCGGEVNPAEDETTTNLIMAWYWAGYYAGLSRGQTQAGHLDHKHPEERQSPEGYQPCSPNAINKPPSPREYTTD